MANDEQSSAVAENAIRAVSATLQVILRKNSQAMDDPIFSFTLLPSKMKKELSGEKQRSVANRIWIGASLLPANYTTVEVAFCADSRRCQQDRQDLIATISQSASE